MARTFRALSLLMLFAVLPWQTAQAQAPTFTVTAFFYEGMDDTLDRLAIRLATEHLETQGWASASNPRWTVLVKTTPFAGDTDLLAVSVVAMQNMPEPVVALGREHEAFYLAMARAEQAPLPAEGRKVRQHMSEAFMRQFAMAHHHDVAVVPRADLKAGLATLLDRMVTDLNP